LPHFFIGALTLSKDDTGVISGVLVVLGEDLGGKEVTDSEKEAITALCAAGALVGAILAGITSDKYGRKPAIWFSSILFVSIQAGGDESSREPTTNDHPTCRPSVPLSKQPPSRSSRCVLDAFVSDLEWAALA
jgi:hypothetical protein